jgi:hypothetical protein
MSPRRGKAPSASIERSNVLETKHKLLADCFGSWPCQKALGPRRTSRRECRFHVGSLSPANVALHHHSVDDILHPGNLPGKNTGKTLGGKAGNKDGGADM